MKQIFLILFVALSFQLQAQIGISASFLNQDVPEWELIAIEEYGNEAENKFLNSGFEVGFDYWFRFKNFRVEFFPTVSYSNVTSKFVNPHIDLSTAEGKYAQNNFGLHLKTNVYPLDFEGDCDCPTWKKDGNVIKKGWFIQLIGGAKAMNNSYQFSGFSESQKAIVWEAGIGTGLDIGISEFLTVTPYVNYILTFNSEWMDLEKLASVAVDFPTNDDLNVNPTDMNRLVFGVRLGFRFDELNKYGVR